MCQSLRGLVLVLDIYPPDPSEYVQKQDIFENRE